MRRIGLTAVPGVARVVVAGSVNMDVVTRVERFPQPGETLLADAARLTPGGKGANQAVAARRCGAAVELVGRVGADAFGDALLQFLRDEDVSVSRVSVSESSPTGAAVITVDGRGENTIVVASGANHEVAPDDVRGLGLGPGDVVLSQNEIGADAIAALFEHAAEAGALSVLNAAPALAGRAGVVALADVVVVNETERTLLPEARPGQIVVVTLGARGASAATPDGEIHIAGRPVEAMDTTGAGDCFVGALAARLSEGAGLEQSLRFANAAASLAVQRRGAGAAMPRRHEVDALLTP